MFELKTKEQKEVSAKQKQEYKYLGSMRMINGLKLWEYDTQTNVLKLAEIQKNNAVNFGTKKASGNSKVTHNPKAIYIQALNYKNAKRKIEKKLARMGVFVSIP